MNKIEYLLVIVYAFIMMLTGLLDDYRNVSLVKTLVASIVLFYIYYAIGLSFIFITNGIYGLYKKFKRKEPDYTVTFDVVMDEPITEEKVKCVMEKVQKEQRAKGIRT